MILDRAREEMTEQGSMVSNTAAMWKALPSGEAAWGGQHKEDRTRGEL